MQTPKSTTRGEGKRAICLIHPTHKRETIDIPKHSVRSKLSKKRLFKGGKHLKAKRNNMLFAHFPPTLFWIYILFMPLLLQTNPIKSALYPPPRFPPNLSPPIKLWDVPRRKRKKEKMGKKGWYAGIFDYEGEGIHHEKKEIFYGSRLSSRPASCSSGWRGLSTQSRRCRPRESVILKLNFKINCRSFCWKLVSFQEEK